MSYDLRIKVKVEGLTDTFVPIAYPQYDSPTYNLGTMFRKCMNWDFTQGENYNCHDIIGNVIKGIYELSHNRELYEQYNPPNGWGTIDSALVCLESLLECMKETVQNYEIPIEYLYMSW